MFGISAAYTSGPSVAVGVVAAGVSGLHAANGLVFRYWSTKFAAR